MRLIACPHCHAQYDVTHVAETSFDCRCGERLENRALRAVDSEIHRCGGCGASVPPGAKRCEYCRSAIVRDPRWLSLICPECYARTHPDARFCTACGVAFAPQELGGEAPELDCPACGAALTERRVADARVSECGECGGLWAPGPSFEALVNRAIEARRRGDPERITIEPRVRGSNPAAQRIQYRRCPECDAYMQRRNFMKSSGVITDVCRTHGTWLDADELEQIAGFILSGCETAPSLLEVPAPIPRAASSPHPFLIGRRNDSDDAGGLMGSLLDVLAGLLR